MGPKEPRITWELLYMAATWQIQLTVMRAFTVMIVAMCLMLSHTAKQCTKLSEDKNSLTAMILCYIHTHTQLIYGPFGFCP